MNRGALHIIVRVPTAKNKGHQMVSFISGLAATMDTDAIMPRIL